MSTNAPPPQDQFDERPARPVIKTASQQVLDTNSSSEDSVDEKKGHMRRMRTAADWVHAESAAKEKMTGGSGEFMTDSQLFTVCQILLAIFWPPLAVFLERGWGLDFCLNLLLTILMYLPGLLHALYIVLKYESRIPSYQYVGGKVYVKSSTSDTDSDLEHVKVIRVEKAAQPAAQPIQPMYTSAQTSVPTTKRHQDGEAPTNATSKSLTASGPGGPISAQSPYNDSDNEKSV